MSRATLQSLKERGAHLHEWGIPSGLDDVPNENEVLARLVASFATTDADIDAFARALG
jgi:threonine aldolase